MSARSSSSGAGSSPRVILRARAVPGSTMREYAETWSGCAGQRGLERERPVVEGLPRRAVDEVEADLLEAGLARPVDDGGDAQGVVGAVEGGEHAVDRRLHAEAEPGEAGLAQRLEVREGDAVGVGLGGHLDAGGEAELRGDRGQDRREVTRPEQRRRTAAEEDGDRQVAVAQDPPSQPDLRDRGLGVRRPARPGLVAQLGGGVGVEVAVAAPDRAERHVHVEPERRLPSSASAASGSAPSAGAGSPAGSEDGTRHPTTSWGRPLPYRRAAGTKTCSPRGAPGTARRRKSFG